LLYFNDTKVLIFSEIRNFTELRNVT
jgi:hypothetical protein